MKYPCCVALPPAHSGPLFTPYRCGWRLASQVDIWSCGVVLYTLLVGRPPYESRDVKSTSVAYPFPSLLSPGAFRFLTFRMPTNRYKRILANSYSFPDNLSLSTQAKDLIQAMLQTRPELRPSIDSIKRHPFFNRNDLSPPLEMPTSALTVPPKFTASGALIPARVKGSIGSKEERTGPAPQPLAPRDVNGIEVAAKVASRSLDTRNLKSGETTATGPTPGTTTTAGTLPGQEQQPPTNLIAQPNGSTVCQKPGPTPPQIEGKAEAARPEVHRAKDEASMGMATRNRSLLSNDHASTKHGSRNSSNVCNDMAHTDPATATTGQHSRQGGRPPTLGDVATATTGPNPGSEEDSPAPLEVKDTNGDYGGVKPDASPTFAHRPSQSGAIKGPTEALFEGERRCLPAFTFSFVSRSFTYHHHPTRNSTRRRSGHDMGTLESIHHNLQQSLAEPRSDVEQGQDIPRASYSHQPSIWVSQYVDYTSKYGLGFLLVNGSAVNLLLAKGDCVE